MAECSLHGFSFLRNGLKFDYPFVESLKALAAATDTQVLALGQSEDGTEDSIQALSGELTRLEVLPTIWDERLRTGGLILSQQTNVALNALRANVKSETNAWGLYLQADELIHENDISQLRADIERAHAQNCDAVSFRYIHFWRSFHQIAINKKWYPEEIRAVRLNGRIESWGDAQSFRNYTRVYTSDVPIYHYGHIKRPDALAQKLEYFVNLHHDTDEEAKRKSLAKEHKPQRSIAYYGPHPKWMKARMGPEYDFIPKRLDQPLCILRAKELPEALQQRLAHFQPQIICKLSEIRNTPADAIVVLEESALRRWWYERFYPSRTPRAMLSKHARPWPLDFWLTLRLSEKGYGLK